MNQNTNLRFAALSLSAVLLTAALTACGGSGGRNTTTTGTTSASSTTTMTSATSDTHVGTGTDNGTHTGTDHGTGTATAVIPGVDNSGTGTGTGVSSMVGEIIPDFENVDLANAVVRFNGSDYRVSGEEELRRDEIGVELLVVKQTVDKLENDGDATGLPAGVKVWSIKDNTDYSAVAVEIDGMYYRASKQAS